MYLTRPTLLQTYVLSLEFDTETWGGLPWRSYTI